MIYTKLIGIKLLNRIGDESDFVIFDISCVNYVDLYKPTENSGAVPAYHTPNGSYLALSTIRDLAKGYERFGFKRYGGSTVINESRVSKKIVEENGTTVIFMCGSVVKVRKKHKL